MVQSAGNKKQKAVICGATGFIGKTLSRFLFHNGFQVITLNRHDIEIGVEHVAKVLEEVTLVVNLAGAPIFKRWTEKYQQVIYHSRIDTTRILVNAVLRCRNKPSLFISTSAVGIYNSVDVHDEFSENLDPGFLGQICLDWERATYPLKAVEGLRLVIFRLGVVLSEQGGAFPRMALPFRFFIGGKIGKGDQWFPFIHLNDLLGAYWFAIVNKNAMGVYNLVAPKMVTNAYFSKVLARACHGFSWLPVPVFVLKFLYGNAATVLTEGQHVKPHRLIVEGFNFEYPTAEKTIAALTSKQ
jgi:hypothetical protein